jgi:NAD(P)-dependent dehydrogenase (short-subunit alcohol dehydrogenase family)
MSLAPSHPADTRMLADDVFAGAVAVITEPGDVVGQAIAVELARGGAEIVLAGRDPAAFGDITAAVAAGGGKARGLALDITDAEAVKRAFDEIERAHGPITLLVNHVPDTPDLPVERMSLERWRDVTRRVIDGAFICARDVGLRRIADRRAASIVNSGTPYDVTGGAGMADLTAAKAAVMNLTKSLAVEWAPYDIRVNGVAAGYVAGAEAGPVAESDLAETVPAGRLCEPHEVAWCVAYMCSPFAAYLTGATIALDGASWQRPGRSPPLFSPILERYERATGKA